MVDKDSIIEYKVYRIACYPPVFFHDTIFNERHDIIDSVVFETEVRPQYKRHNPNWSVGTFNSDKLKYVVNNNDTNSIFFMGFESIGGSGSHRYIERDTVKLGDVLADVYKFEFYRPEIQSLPQKEYLKDTIPEFLYLDTRTFFPVQFDGEYISLQTDSIFSLKRKVAREFFQARKLDLRDTLNFITKPDHLTRRIGLKKE